MEENKAYSMMKDLNFNTNNKTDEEQANDNQRVKMLEDIQKQLAFKGMIDPIAAQVDFFTNTYRGGKIGGGKSVTDTVNAGQPAIGQQAAILGWMGKPSISKTEQGLTPYQTEMMKYRNKKDEDDTAKTQDKYKQMFWRSDFDKDYRGLTKRAESLIAAEEKINLGTISGLVGAVKGLIRSQGEDVGNLALQELKMQMPTLGLPESINAWISNVESGKATPAQIAYVKEQLLPAYKSSLIESVDTFIDSKAVNAEPYGFSLDEYYEQADKKKNVLVDLLERKRKKEPAQKTQSATNNQDSSNDAKAVLERYRQLKGK